MDFSLSSYFNNFDTEGDYDVDISKIDSKLEDITRLLANNPEAVNYNVELFEDLIDCVHRYKVLSTKIKKQILYLIFSSVKIFCQQYSSAINGGDFIELIENYKQCFEKYSYMLYVVLSYLGKEDFSGLYTSRGKSSDNALLSKWKDNCSQIEDGLDAITNILKLDLSKVFVTTPERDFLMEIFSKPIFSLLESPQIIKIQNIKFSIFQNLAIMVKFHAYGNVIQASVLQYLMYYTHLPACMAEFLHTLDTAYEYTGLTEEVLREISQLEFNSNDNNGPKSVSEFLVKLSELNPRAIYKQMSYISQLLDNSNMSLRCSVVETCGNTTIYMLKDNSHSDEKRSDGYHHVDKLIELLSERFLDQNPYVRTKAIQAITKICNLPVKLSALRKSIVPLAVRSLEDKSTLVRRNIIKLLERLILTHPFTAVHGTQLSYDFWKSKLKEAEQQMERYLPMQENQKNHADELNYDQEQKDQMDIDEINDSSSNIDHDELNTSMIEQEKNLPDTNTLVKAKLTLQYYQDAVEFIENIIKAAQMIEKLLFSKNRNEVLEAMDFFVLSDAFDIQFARNGIQKMLHLVWMKGSSDEGKSIASHLVDCYKDLFLVAPKDSSPVQKAGIVAKNLIELTYVASAADLASLEKLLSLIYTADLIDEDTIKMLWHIYVSNGTEYSDSFMKQKRGSIIILGMLALADSNIALKGLDALLSVGLGKLGMEDLVIAKYTCIALQRTISVASPNNRDEAYRFTREEESIEKLQDVVLRYSDEPEYYTVLEQALNAIDKISSKPEQVFTCIIQKKTKITFENSENEKEKIVLLSQLLFIVGHISMKTIIHLEKLEAEFKRNKQKNGTADNDSANNDEDKDDAELEMIGGTSEDDFADAVVYIKERELLYGEFSLLAKFGPMVTEICSNTKLYDNEGLQRAASLCMAKLMCVSSKYCEENLPLLINIMENSPDPIIRSNCVLGLGDMAVCFNNLVDENTDFLYRRLNDTNIMVQRTCLMTVTFLILAGQVKVKGQLASMAKCLENEDQGITDMCKLFFIELATKDNAIYNGFIDIFSGLSSDRSLAKDSMKRIIKFLIGFIEKEKQQKQLSEKLLTRLSKVDNEEQWNDVAYVLGIIPYKNEEITGALESGFNYVKARE